MNSKNRLRRGVRRIWPSVHGEIPRAGQNPLAVYLLGLCVTAGVSFVVGSLTGTNGTEPVERLLPGPVILAWYALLLGGGLLTIVGVYLPDRVTSLLVERAGLTSIGPMAILYAAGLFLIGRAVTFGSGVATFLFGLFCLWRIQHIRRELRHIRRME